jgi:myosin heavy subunit
LLQVREVDAETAKTMVALDPQCLDPNVDNLVGLSNLTEDAILHNLRIRFQRDWIYTCISSILIAVNPFRQLPLYTVDVLQSYATSREKASLPPHIFSVADQAFHNMLKDSVSQSVVISGESGAGKTESTKLILQYLAEVSGSINTENSIEQQILQANPLMEAFGNAKTARNNNSSRFGKLITVYFNHNGEIVGGSVINYLLEKSRVTSVQESERNYHVFYELLAGVEQVQREE